MMLLNVVYAEHSADGYAVHSGDATVVWTRTPLADCDLYAYCDAGSFRGREGLGGRHVLLMFEPYVVLPGEYREEVFHPFDAVFTFLGSLAARGGKYYQIRFPAYGWPHDRDHVTHWEPPPRDPSASLGAGSPPRRNALCMIAGHKRSHVADGGELYSRRLDAARWFHERSALPFDVYGLPAFDLPNYRGSIPRVPYAAKHAVLARYRYSLCFENVYHPVWSRGYLSEKMLDCLAAGTVPIYLGCYDVEMIVPPECFIDMRRFAGWAELDRFLTDLSDAEYHAVVDAGREWVQAGNLDRFTCDALYDALRDFVTPADPAPGAAPGVDRPAPGRWARGPAPARARLPEPAPEQPPVWRLFDLATQTPAAPCPDPHAGDPLVSIVIVTAGRRAALRTCLDALRRHTPHRTELVVIDNASADGTAEYLAAQRDLTVLRNADDLGCPPARRQGLSLAGGDFVVLLDDDTAVTPGWLDTLLAHFRRAPQLGLAGPRSNWVSGDQRVADVPYGPDLAGLERFARRWTEDHRAQATPTRRLVGFCMAIRRAVIERIGVSDASFGRFGYEDDDFTLRALIAGFAAAIAQDVFIHHTGGPEGRADPAFQRLMIEASRRFVEKWGLVPQHERRDPAAVARALAGPFDPARHYVPPAPPAELAPLLCADCRARPATAPSGG